jgi:hypothetical protein
MREGSECADALCDVGKPTARWDQRLSKLERNAELAALVAMTNLPADDSPTYSWFLSEAAVHHLLGSTCS